MGDFFGPGQFFSAKFGQTEQLDFEICPTRQTLNIFWNIASPLRGRKDSDRNSNRNSPKPVKKDQSEIDPKSARERRQAARERLQKEENSAESEKFENLNDTAETERLTTELVVPEKVENSVDDMNGDAKSIDSDIPDLEDCPPERTMSPAGPPGSPGGPPETEVTIEEAVTDFVVEDLKSEPVDAEIPVKPVKKLSELAAKKSEPPEEVQKTPEKTVKNPLDALPEPKTKSEKPGAKIEEIFAKLEEEQKLKESKRQQNITNSPKKIEEKPKEVAEMAAILSTMKKTQPPTKNVDSMSSAISKLIGKPAAGSGPKPVENDPSEPIFPENEIENSAEITGSDLQLPFSENEGIVVGQE